MALTAEQIRAARNQLADELFRNGSCPFTKADLEAAIVAADAWATTNAAGFNTALPQPFRGTATTEQKAALLMFVTAKRYLG